MTAFKNSFFSISLSLVLFSFSNCGGTQKASETELEQNPPFTVAEASFQKWVAGTQEGGSGVDVFINISNVSEGVVLQDLFFRNKKSQLNTSPTVRSQYIAHFKNSSSDPIMDIDPTKEAKNTPPEKTPFTLNQNEAVISYDYNGTTAYFKIEQLEEKEMLAYPGGNPNDEN